MKLCTFQLKPQHALFSHVHTRITPSPSLCSNLNAISFFSAKLTRTTKKISASSVKVIPKDSTDHEETMRPETYRTSDDKLSRWMVVGGATLGVVLLLMGIEGQEARAFGPEGPLVEEFWDNMRRYGLYFLTVSTGAIYTILQPIFELLKNPVSAILLLIVLAGSFYIVSQVLTAMVGISSFEYKYGY